MNPYTKKVLIWYFQRIFTCYYLINIKSLCGQIYFKMLEVYNSQWHIKNYEKSQINNLLTLFNPEMRAPLVTQWERICLPMQEVRVASLGMEEPLEKEIATHSSILAWEIQRQRSLAGYSSWGRKRVKHDLVTKHACLLHVASCMRPILIYFLF